ncbi:MAG: LamG domain-containing protein [Phycisphaerae bacterium]|jgi:tetratricopeptide (TPR) repeat protein|nr:LamG domain-containing protein [Phycisphaerae bacterium]
MMKTAGCTFRLFQFAAAAVVATCTLTLWAQGDRQEGAQLIKDTVAGSKSSAEAAARLMRVALMLNDSPKVQADFCRKAYEYGVKTSAGHGEALAAINILARIEPEQADQWSEKRIALYRTIYSRSKPDKKREAGVRLVELLKELADARNKEGRFSEALKSYTAAFRTATVMKLDGREAIADRIKEVSASLYKAKRFESLKKKLTTEPDNEKTRNEIIEMCLLEFDSPSRAAEFITEDGDETLRTYIPLAGKPSGELTEAECLELGRWYRSLADNTLTKARKTVAFNRAITYLQRYLDLHEKPGADREKISDELIGTMEAARKILGGLAPKGSVLVVTFEKRTMLTIGGKNYFVDTVGKRIRGLMAGGTLAPGRAGLAMKFDGKAYVDFGNPKAIQVAGSQMICMWLKPANLSARQNPLNKSYGGEGTMTLELKGTISYFCGSAGKNAHPYAGYSMRKPLKPGKWAHIALVRDAKAGKVIWYRDGQAVSSYKLKHRIAASKLPLLLGKGYVRNYQGLMDEFALFNRALTAKEIKTIFETGQKGLTLQ